MGCVDELLTEEICGTSAYQCFLHKLAEYLPPGAVLDFGCGTNPRLAPFFERGWRCVGVDIDPEAVETAAQYGDAILRDGERPLPLPNNYFDLIYAVQVFHHIRDVNASFAETVRCLKPGGLMVIFETVEDGFPIRWARAVFKKWRGVPILSRMYISDWLSLFDVYGLKLVALYGRNWRNFLTSFIKRRYLRLSVIYILQRFDKNIDFRDIAEVLFVLQKL